jgi:hypothetical protein
VLSTETLFYTCIIPFIIFFGAFAFVIYPMRDALHPNGEQPVSPPPPSPVPALLDTASMVHSPAANPLPAAAAGGGLLVHQFWC